MKRAILFILTGIMLNTMDRVFSGEIQNPVIVVSEFIYPEPDHSNHYFLDKQCYYKPSEILSGLEISYHLDLHIPIKFILNL